MKRGGQLNQHEAEVERQKQEYAFGTSIALDMSKEREENSAVAHVSVGLQLRVSRRRELWSRT
jgi:hypothetical protein